MLAVLLVIALLALFLPLQTSLRVHAAGSVMAEVTLSVWRMKRTWQMMLTHDGGALTLILLDGKRDQQALNPADLPQSRGMRLLQALLPLKKSLVFLLQRLRLLQLTVNCRIHLDNAAHTALLTGAVRALLPILPAAWRPGTRISILPSFHHSTSLAATCIVRIRLGMILITTALFLGEYLLQAARKAREAGKLWNIPSAN